MLRTKEEVSLHITLFAFGSWGDVRPLVVLGKGLQSAGHHAQVVASPGYEDWVRARGVDFQPLTDDVSQIVGDLSSTDITSPLEQIRIVREVLKPVFTRTGLDVLEATRDSDALLTVEFSLAVLLGIIQQNGLKTIVVNPAPLTPTRAFVSAAPPAPGWLPFKGWYNRFSYATTQMGGWGLLSGPRKALAAQLGISKRSFSDYRAVLAETPTLTLVSPAVVPRPEDWEVHQQVTGYLFDDDSDWAPPQDLLDFLSAGEPPVYVGFGSMADHKPEATTRLIIEAARRARKRAVILTGWAGLGLDDVPEDIFLLKFASHHWLFPRMAAVVHHGGAGTTAAGLRAGVPTVIVPFNADQPFWGRTIARNGAGPPPIPKKNLGVENLSRAIREAAESERMRANAQTLGEVIRKEDGLGETVNWVERFLV